MVVHRCKPIELPVGRSSQSRPVEPVSRGSQSSQSVEAASRGHSRPIEASQGSQSRQSVTAVRRQRRRRAWGHSFQSKPVKAAKSTPSRPKILPKSLPGGVGTPWAAPSESQERQETSQERSRGSPGASRDPPRAPTGCPGASQEWPKAAKCESQTASRALPRAKS